MRDKYVEYILYSSEVLLSDSGYIHVIIHFSKFKECTTVKLKLRIVRDNMSVFAHAFQQMFHIQFGILISVNSYWRRLCIKQVFKEYMQTQKLKVNFSVNLTEIYTNEKAKKCSPDFIIADSWALYNCWFFTILSMNSI